MNHMATFFSSFGMEIVCTGIGSVVIATSLGLLYREQRTYDSNLADAIGVVSYKYNSGQRKAERNMVWQDMEMEAPVFNRDTIRTAEQSEATVRLTNGASISLDELSMVFLEVGSEESELKLERGSVRVKAASPGKPLFVRSGNETVRLEQGDLQASRSGDALSLVVREGSATLPGDEGKELRTIEAGYQVNLDAKGETKSAIGPAPLSPADGSSLPMDADPTPLAFSWSAASEKTVLFELSRDRSFSAVMERKTLDAASVRVPLRAGLYYWRVSAANGGTPGPVARFTLLPAPNPPGGSAENVASPVEQPALTVSPGSPPNDALIDLSVTDSIVFRWRCSRNDARFTFSMWPLDPTLPARRITLQTTRPQAIIPKSPDLPPGAYAWTVKAWSGSESAVSRTGTLRLQAPPPIAPQNDTPEVQYVE